MTVSNGSHYRLGGIDKPVAPATIRTARAKASYSLDDLALTCGLTVQELADIEEGRDQDPGKLKRVAAALKINSSELASDRPT